ncbi:hypothetical protein JNB63_11830 [Microbacterium trichothecenolyticum]|uniref:hypothetical protein n=1 Tax=Microbacterium trichothecenolyticum TaxID=69370 RepID=UPI001C6E8899|nr:hypothetical protein [Microbacterium trichothecenolyticum]MBW9120784.1 hypothetical protein [Microbacterium trichothecenolyticum]
MRVDLTGKNQGECIVVTIHDVRHHLHSTTAKALNDRLTEKIDEWDAYAKSRGALGVLPSAEETPAGIGPFDAHVIADELAHAKAKTRNMVRGTLGMFGPRGELTRAHFPLLGFIERAQAFSLGVIAMVEAGNPLGAATLLRSLAENLATAFYVTTRPSELPKLQPGAEHGLPIGRVIAAAEKSLPGFKSMYDNLTAMAHPSGAGAFQTLKVADDGTFTWQSHPTFKDLSQAKEMLSLLDDLGDLSAQVIQQTVSQLAGGATVVSSDHPSTPSKGGH